MADTRLEKYLQELASALDARGVWEERTIKEARAHLMDAVDARLRSGHQQDVAERDAIAAFGHVDLIAERAAADRKEYHDWRPSVALTRMLAACCWCTVLATVYLTLSLLILRPPHANYWSWTPTATYFLAQSGLTLSAVFGL